MASTLTEHLSQTKSTSGVSEAAYDAFLSGPVSKWASWAIWGDKVDDLSVFDIAGRPWERLRSDVLILGGNTGLVGDGEMKRCGNFHTAGHSPDGKLRNSLRGTPLEGAFLSDVVKDYPTKDSGPLKRDIKNGAFDIRAHVVDPLLDELELLGSPDEVIVLLLGKETVNVWDAVMSHDAVPQSLLSRLTVVTGLPHHSKAGALAQPVQDLLASPLQPHPAAVAG